MPKYSSGLQKIEMGAIAGDGGMGTILADVGQIYQGTASFIEDAASLTDHFSEQGDDPILTVATKGAKTVKFTLVDVLPSVLVLFLGGTAAGTGPAFTLEAPLVTPTIEQSLKITTKEGFTIAIPRARIIANVTWNFGKTEIAKIDVTAKILTPTKAATAAWKLTLA